MTDAVPVEAVIDVAQSTSSSSYTAARASARRWRACKSRTGRAGRDGDAATCWADYFRRLDRTCQDASPNGGIRTSTCPRRRPEDTHQPQSSARCLTNYDRIRPIMTASSPDSRACRCLRRPGGGCRTRLSYGSRFAAFRSDTDSSAPSSCAAGHPSER